MAAILSTAAARPGAPPETHSLKHPLKRSLQDRAWEFLMTHDVVVEPILSRAVSASAHGDDPDGGCDARGAVRASPGKLHRSIRIVFRSPEASPMTSPTACGVAQVTPLADSQNAVCLPPKFDLASDVAANGARVAAPCVTSSPRTRRIKFYCSSKAPPTQYDDGGGGCSPKVNEIRGTSSLLDAPQQTRGTSPLPDAPQRHMFGDDNSSAFAPP